MSTDRPTVQGEGDHEAARRYDDAAKRFVEDGKVAPAAERARTDEPGELADLERAEDAGRARAREEDPLLQPGSVVPRPGVDGGVTRAQREAGRQVERPDGGGGEGSPPG